MASPRVLGYDDLYGWAEARVDDANSDCIDAEDDDARSFAAGRMSAFTDLIAHIEHELMAARYAC